LNKNKEKPKVDFKKHLTTTVAAGALFAFGAPVDAVAGAVNAANSKISFSIGARVHRSLVHVDDGVNSAIFQGSGTSGNSEVWFSGSGKLTESVTMGAYMRWDIDKNDDSYSFSSTGAQTNANNANGNKYEYIYFKHASGNKLSLGDQEGAADGAFRGSYGGFAGQPGVSMDAVSMTRSDTDAQVNTKGAYFSSLDGGNDTNNKVRFDSQNFGGFTLAGDLAQGGGGGVKLSWGGTVSGLSAGVSLATEFDGGGDQYTGGSVKVKHGSGLHVAVGMSELDYDIESATVKDIDNTFVVAGFETSMNSLGKTNLSVRYAESENTGGDDNEGESLTLALNQALDAVGGKIVLQYEQMSFDGETYDLNDVDIFVLETAFNF